MLNRTGLWRAVLAGMIAVLALVGFWPTPVDRPVDGQIARVLFLLHTHGIPAWFNYAFIEASANVILFIPFGFVAARAFPTRRWWQVAALGLLVSGCMELGQKLFLPQRFASLQDVVTNVAGTVIGIVLAEAAVLFFKQKQVRRQPASYLPENDSVT